MWKVGCSLVLRLKHMGVHVSNNEQRVSSDHSTKVCIYCICHCRGSFPSKMWRVTHQQLFLWESVPLFILTSLQANFKIVTKIGFKQEVWSNFSHVPERSCILYLNGKTQWILLKFNYGAQAPELQIQNSPLLCTGCDSAGPHKLLLYSLKWIMPHKGCQGLN
jgi:hypothetical protein